MNITDLTTELENLGLALSVDTAGQLVATGPAAALTDEIKELLKRHKPDLIRHLSPRWVTREVVQAALAAAVECGYWPASFALEHPSRGRVCYPEPGLLLDACLDGIGLDAPTLPIVGPGPVVQAGDEVQVVVYPTMLVVFSPYSKEFVSDLKGHIPPASRGWDDLVKGWWVNSLYSTALADLIDDYWRVDFLPGIRAIQEGTQ